MTRFEDHRMSFEPEGDAYRGFELGEEEETARGPLILALALGVLVVFAAVVWNTYRQGVRDPGDVPLIRADTAPYKTPGENPRARSVEGTGETFYNQFDSGEDAPRRLGQDRYKVAGEGDPAPDEALQGGPAIDLTEGPDGSGTDAGAGPREDQLRALAELASDALDDLSPSAPGETAAATPETAPAPPAPASAPAAPPAPSPAQAQAQAQAPPPRPAGLSGEGGFLVQLAAYRSQDAADAGWAELSRRHGVLLNATEKRVQRADLGAKGVFYRLRAGAFDTRAHASAFCDRLKGEGLDCIVVVE